MFLTVIWGAAAMFMALFWVKERDLADARQDLRNDGSPPSRETTSVMPNIFRRNFWFGEPLPGQRGKYQWEVNGDRSVPVDAQTDKVFGFKGKTQNRGETVELSSPLVLLNKENRTISSRDGVVVQLDWAKIEAREMLMEMQSSDTRFSGGVTTQIDTEEAKKRQGNPAPPVITEKKTEAKPEATDKPPEKKKKTPLVITSDELRMFAKKNLAIFIGNVVAKDESGVIVADRMEALNYSEEETKKDANLKGVKTVICTGNVKIDQLGKKQAVCERAVYDAKANTVHLYYDAETGKKVVYRDEEEKWQAEAQEMILDRNTNEVRFLGGESQVKTVDFNEDRKSFLGFMEPDRPKSDKEKPAGDAGK
jgi:lipopolysaccharide export system protein LptA